MRFPPFAEIAMQKLEFIWDDRRTQLTLAAVVICGGSLLLGIAMLASMPFRPINAIAIAMAVAVWWIMIWYAKRTTVWKIRFADSQCSIFTCDGLLSAMASMDDLCVHRKATQIVMVLQEGQRTFVIPREFPDFESICESVW